MINMCQKKKIRAGGSKRKFVEPAAHDHESYEEKRDSKKRKLEELKPEIIKINAESNYLLDEDPMDQALKNDNYEPDNYEPVNYESEEKIYYGNMTQDIGLQWRET